MHTQFEANILIEKYFENVTDTLDPNNFTDKGFQVERTFLPYQQDSTLFIMAIKVYDKNNKLITKQKEILYLNNPSKKQNNQSKDALSENKIIYQRRKPLPL